MSYSTIQRPLSNEALFTENFEKAFSEFLNNYLDRKEILNKNKTVILKQCRKKFKDDEIEKMDAAQAQAKILEIIKQTVYSCAAIPTPFIGKSDSLEVGIFDQQSGEVSDLNAVARNLFRYITRGSEIDATRQDIKKCLALVQKALGKKYDPKLTSTLREEFQTILKNIATNIASTSITADDEKQYEILISNLLATYPFLSPHEDPRKILSVPQKIDGLGWQTIEYHVEALDLSPQTGLISKLVRDEDRIYAYGLTPVDQTSQAQRQLLLMGTTYPTGQGAKFSNLHKFDPKHSVGENIV